MTQGEVMSELKKLQEIMAHVLRVDPQEVQDETTVMKDLGADSLDLYQILTAVENAYRIHINESEFKKIRKVKDIELLIQTKR
jgi:acyl carrier protein